MSLPQTFESIVAQVKEIVIEMLGLESTEFDADTALDTLDKNFDSLDLVEVVMCTEDTFNVVMDDDRISAMKPITCKSIATYVQELLL